MTPQRLRANAESLEKIGNFLIIFLFIHKACSYFSIISSQNYARRRFGMNFHKKNNLFSKPCSEAFNFDLFGVNSIFVVEFSLGKFNNEKSSLGLVRLLQNYRMFIIETFFEFKT